ncbi:MAG: alpha/beta hydrolase [Candidatus Thermofonsia Clade 1 bacterium]|uniref:Alpha/beta hydrolase n=1 Tax=Candidatus Thermofonsia Clade 1 bacterium TaxID=2364210 RepID=A0A2M8PDF9_9CHLR|nr:MAG: alpha/beta hydrolase [Candidatus Thermofonsia Clade 1 bacterium]RMF52414.1 MAG: alpha/beta fold hydrolase [Chloroflexota bacterium]
MSVQPTERPATLPTALLGALTLGTAAALSWIAYSRFFINHHYPLPSALEAERRTFVSPTAGLLSYYRALPRDSNSHRPLVLIHSVNAAASAYEMRPIFEHYRGTRPIYALDLPGFGFSERSDRRYTPQLFSAAIADLLRTQIRTDQPVDIVALSLGCEFAAQVALDLPERVHALALISPTGLAGRRANSIQQAQRRGASEWLYRTFSFPLWSQALYDLLATRASIRFFLKQSFEGAPDEGLIAYAYATSHRRGARYAPLHFISGKLFSADILERVYLRLRVPTLAIYDQDAFTRFDALPSLLAQNACWRAVQIAPTRGLPHFERMAEVAQALDEFWA